MISQSDVIAHQNEFHQNISLFQLHKLVRFTGTFLFVVVQSHTHKLQFDHHESIVQLEVRAYVFETQVVTLTIHELNQDTFTGENWYTLVNQHHAVNQETLFHIVPAVLSHQQTSHQLEFIRQLWELVDHCESATADQV